MAIRRNFRTSLICILLLVNGLIFAGETGKLSGKVIEAATKQPSFGANVVIVSRLVDGQEENISKQHGATTDINGNYFILNIPPGTYTVKCSYIGFKDEVITNVKVMIDKTTKVDFSLVAGGHTTSEVVVTAFNDKKVEVDLTATKQTYEIEKVRELAGIEDIGDILTLQPDIIDDHFRGGRVGQSAYLMGGTSIVNPLSNQRAFSPIVSGLKTVEVLTSGFSAEYGNAQSGVINMVPREGGEKWKTSLDISGTLPGYKTWGGSPYSTSNLQFYNLLKNVDEWLNENKVTPGKYLWDNGYGFSNYMPSDGSFSHADSLRVASISRANWLQSIRDVGLEYDNTVDSRFDLTLSGPVSDNVKVFFVGRQRTTYAIVPTTEPNLYRQMMANITFQPTNDDKIGLRLTWDNSFENSFSSSNWLRYLFNRTLTMNKLYQSNIQAGLDWSRVLNAANVFNLKLNYLNLRSSNKLELLTDDQYQDVYTTQSNWYNYYGPSNHQIGSFASNRGLDIVQTYDMHANITSQFNTNNLLKAGFQFTYNNLNVDRDMSITNAASYRKVKFNVFPFEGGLYAQDKLEFEGFIANVGLRLDYYDMNTSYYSDLYSPLRNPYYDETKPIGEKGAYYDASLALKTKTKLYTRLQPRVGFSFPVSESSVFHVNYGTFTQRPSYDQIFYNQVNKYGDIQILGNPRLKPENTKMYDIGIVNAFPGGFKLDVSAYYKDIKDLVDAAYYVDRLQQVYQTYTNRDYSDVKGFFITVENNDDNLDLFVRYNYESATGKSATSLDAPVTYYENPAEGYASVKLPDPEDIFMNYDRTHKLTSNIRYKFLNDEGPELDGIYPLENMSFSITFSLYSGRPYTWDVNGEGLKYNKRTPTEKELRARVQKAFKFGSTSINFYAEGLNLLNGKIYNYTGVFDNTVNTPRWEYDQRNIDTYTYYEPYTTSQSVYIYSNQPRNFRFGVIVNF